MIITHIEYLSTYIGVNPYMKYLVDYFQSITLEEIAEGSISIHEDKVFGNCFTYIADGTAGDFFETHHKYIDVHLVIKNVEDMAVTVPEKVTVTQAYDEEKDIELYSGEYEQIVRLNPGICLITFPEDLHQPKVGVNDSEVKKVVFKIAIS
ncbi:MULTISPECIES: YhcH/YjgK/YiaL family protein [unclassified Streptococcus]|uniref:YhcH/YjgK/YiaL family protein n=1 Tax=unclassified Streptococcus TaxID=2608887 RepID=UPI001072CAC2|nr:MULTISPECIES: YhcH/YjgK/YiaL family protein [unclassified Streptococcus]MBF0786875.1 YhcH/YjgK/YiaL family protein [Streptococcus sp. 19428wC2_LYSM12]MCQ9212714.1 YhcH/YjgK/YiaL family protein [Streptococcus sp. B01]MCQ9214055.1 YhcH/YjgK/YiaL family protein [Streptococcus sp. O1]TFV06244.1 YhcH/YjgK/YiaL family protein [Streptococcus sp. LYSM12]